jgi:hypothetical protein
MTPHVINSSIWRKILMSRILEFTKSTIRALLAGSAGLVVLCAPALAQQRTAGELLLPPDATLGACYARVWVPARYSTENVTVLVREASSKLEVTAPRYEWVEEQVLVKPATEKLEIVPAQYEWDEERILVKPASKKLEAIPAQFEWEEERILDRPAHTVWKKGRNPLHNVENGTGEIMCLVEVPATYKTVRKRVLKKEAHTREIEIPAEYTTVRKRVLKEPESTLLLPVLKGAKIAGLGGSHSFD